jgi:hypothetical protein
MNNQFDELTRSMAQSVTRRAALKKFGVGLAGMALACFGLLNKAEAGVKECLPTGSRCHSNSQCCSGLCNGYCYCQPSGVFCRTNANCCSGVCYRRPGSWVSYCL